MSEVENGDNVAPETNDHVVAQESTTIVNDDKQSVKYDTYKRVLGKLKNTEGEYEQLKERLTSLEREKMESEGNKDQLIDSLRKEVMETKGKYKSAIGSVAKSNAMSAIVDEAVKAGCNSTDVVTKFLEDQIANLEFDDSFSPDRDQVKALIEDAKRKAPVLFSKSAPALASHNVNTSGVPVAQTKPLTKLSDDDLMKKWAEAESN